MPYKKYPFPYEFRENQYNAIKFIDREIERKRFVCLDAPTGFGKTPVILSSLLNKGNRILWAVRTGNETDRPIEELKIINEKLHTNYFGISFRGKRDMCLLARKKFKGGGEHEEIVYLCKTERKNCPYYQNLQYFNYFPEEPLLYSEIMKIGEEYEICPYFYQRYLAYYADVISLNYNYILNKNLMWSFKRILDFSQTYLVVDEAHNLQFAYSGIYGDKITMGTIKNALKEAEKSSEIYRIVCRINEDIETFRKRLYSEKKVEDVFIPTEVFGNLDEEDLINLRKYGEKIRKDLLRKGKRPRSSCFRLANFLLKCFENEGIRGVKFIGRRLPKNFELEIYDMRAKEVLSDIWVKFDGVVFCSGTLKPVEAFADIAGIENFAYENFPPDYNSENVKSYVIKGISTRGDKLPQDMADKYINAITEVAKLNRNTAVFCASHRILSSLLRRGLATKLREMGREVFVERKGMSGHKAREILENFKENGGILLATASGRFSEGADYPGKTLEIVFLAGIPFDRVTLKISLYIDYYQELYGEERGEFYSYIVPALRRASQCVGRVLRSKEDKGIFFLGDERYISYRALLPEYVTEGMRVVKVENLYKVVKYLKKWV